MVLLDAVVPFDFEPGNSPAYRYTAESAMKFCGFFRVFYPKYGADSYTKDEAKQRAYIINRQACSKDMVEEDICGEENIRTVNALTPLQLPILAFSTPVFRETTVAYAQRAAKMHIVEVVFQKPMI